MPKLRFKDENGNNYPEWKNKEISEITNYEQPTNFLVNEVQQEGRIPVLTPGKTFIKGYTNDLSGIYKKHPVILFDDFTCALQFVKFDFKIKSSAIKLIKAKNNNIYFLFYLLLNKNYSSPEHKRNWISNISKKRIEIPNIDEQQKIGNTLSYIDELIENKVNEINKLENYKKGLMQKLFAVNKETWLRFKDENGNDYPGWRKSKLGEFLSIPREKIKISDFKKNNILRIKLYRKGIFIDNDKKNLSNSTNYFLRRKGQFIFGKQNVFNGSFYIIPDEYDGSITTSDVPVLNFKENVFKKYIIYLLENKYKSFEKYANGTGSKRIHEQTLLQIMIQSSREYNEQQKIGITLSYLDELIENEQHQKQQLELYKKGLMQQLF